MEVGDRKTELVHIGDGQAKLMTGTVVYIHPRRQFYVLEFQSGERKFRESYYFPARGGNEG